MYWRRGEGQWLKVTQSGVLSVMHALQLLKYLRHHCMWSALELRRGSGGRGGAVSREGEWSGEEEKGERDKEHVEEGEGEHVGEEEEKERVKGDGRRINKSI